MGFVKIVHTIASKATIISCIACVLMMIIAVLNCILRRFGLPIQATYDIVCFLFIIVVSPALGDVEAKKENIYLEILVDHLKYKGQQIVRIITSILCFAFLGIATYGLINRVFRFIETGQTGQTLEIPVWPFVALETLAMVVLCLVFLANIFECINNIKNGEKVGEAVNE